jgi:hypothetical protein
VPSGHQEMVANHELDLITVHGGAPLNPELVGMSTVVYNCIQSF